MFHEDVPQVVWCQKGGELFHGEHFLEGDALDLGSGLERGIGSNPFPGKSLNIKWLQIQAKASI